MYWHWRAKKQVWLFEDCVEIKKDKVFPYSLPSVGPGANPGVQPTLSGRISAFGSEISTVGVVINCCVKEYLTPCSGTHPPQKKKIWPRSGCGSGGNRQQPARLWPSRLCCRLSNKWSYSIWLWETVYVWQFGILCNYVTVLLCFFW